MRPTQDMLDSTSCWERPVSLVILKNNTDTWFFRSMTWAFTVNRYGMSLLIKSSLIVSEIDDKSQIDRVRFWRPIFSCWSAVLSLALHSRQWFVELVAFIVLLLMVLWAVAMEETAMTVRPNNATEQFLIDCRTANLRKNNAKGPGSWIHDSW